MKKIKVKVLEFMQKYNTEEMNNNEFIYYFLRYTDTSTIFNFDKAFMNGPSTEGISRARRAIIRTHGIGKRNTKKEEQNYIKEYALNNKIYEN